MKRKSRKVKSPEVKAKKAQKRKLKVAAEKKKVNLKVAKRTRDLTNQWVIDQRALQLASNRIANLMIALEMAQKTVAELTPKTEAPANGV